LPATRWSSTTSWSACGLLTFCDIQRGQAVFVRCIEVDMRIGECVNHIEIACCRNLMQQRGAGQVFCIRIRAGL
jgi:hypothetical protein